MIKMIRDQAIEPVPTMYVCPEGGIYEAGWRGGKVYKKLKRYEWAVFDSFSKRGSALYEADRRGASNILSPKMISPTHYVRFQLLGP